MLRTYRESVAPEDVGLPRGERRRTPGLRRSELATLAGISVEYLTRLEQGRDRHPSPQVLGALADALMLSSDERFLLLLATKRSSGSSLLCAPDPPGHTVRPSVQALLDQLEPAPVVLINRLTDVLAFTDGYARLVQSSGLLETERPNLIRFIFMDPRARTMYPDWDGVADAWVANLRMDSAPADPHAGEFIDTLTVTAGAAFADRLAAPRTVSRRAGLERLRHPDHGELRLNYETLDLPAGEGERMIVYLSADEGTSAVLDRLAGRRPGALRAVVG